MEFVELAVSEPNLLYVKDEPDDPEIEDTNDNSLADTDPMDLLQLVDEPYYDIDKDVDIDGESVSGGRSTASDTKNSEQQLYGDKWEEWMQEYPWLLHEDLDNCYGYCLYCDQKLCIRGLGHIKGHAASTYHKERGDNYLAFKISEEQANQSNSSIEDIKQEFGTNSRIAAMKFKRVSQIEPLNNFNWRHWLQAHEWLARTQREGTTGFCKYCNVNLNVEFSYLRRRHEQSPKHKLIEKSSKQKQNVPSHDQNQEILYGTHTKKNDDNEDDGKSDGDNDDDVGKGILNAKKPSKELTGPWFERLAKSDNMCRCKLCHVSMHKYSISRHIKTHTHRDKFRLYTEKRQQKQELMINVLTNEKVKVKQEINWKLYEKQHPWITSDPKDSNYAYCKYCETRIMYGQSPTRRHIHENSVAHNRMSERDSNMEAGAEEKESEEVRDEELEDEERKEENDKREEEEDQEVEAEESLGHEKVKRILRGSDVWFELNPWLQKYPKDPNYVYCSYCDVLLLVTNLNVRKHEMTERHRTGEKEEMKKKVASNNGHSVKAKASLLLYSWLVYSKDNSNIVHCKYCRIGFLSSNCKKHNLSVRHKDAAKVYLARKQKRSSKTTLNTVNSTCPHSIQAKVSLWKAKFPWLTYKRAEVRPNYGYCKPCEQSIFIPTYKFLSKHQRSQKHVRMQRCLQHKKEPKKGENDDLEERRTTNESNFNKSVCEVNESERLGEIQNVHQWMLPDKECNPKYVYCKYCELRVMIKGILKRQHEKSAKHQAAEKLYWEKVNNNAEESSKNIGGEKNYSASDGSNGDIAMDDTQSVKSGANIDDDGVLQYLLQNTLKLLKRTNLKLDSSKETPNELSESKRRKLLEDATTTNIAKHISSAQTEIMRLSRALGDKNARDNITENFALAAGLLPLIERQQLSSTPTSATAPLQRASDMSSPSTSLHHRNTFDSFFESVSDTMKNLPPDLAAEGKFKIMQVIYDLEIRALRSKEQQQQPTSTDAFSSIEISAAPAESINQCSNITNVTDNATTTTNGYESENSKAAPATENPNFSNSTIKSSVRIIPISTPQGKMLRRIPANSTVQIMSSGIRCIPINTLKSSFPSSPSGPTSVAQIQTISSHLTTTKQERKSSSVNGINSIVSGKKMQSPTASSLSSTTINKIVALKRKVSDCAGSESDFITIE